MTTTFMLIGIMTVLLGLVILNLTVSTSDSSLRSCGSRLIYGGGAVMWISALWEAFL